MMTNRSPKLIRRIRPQLVDDRRRSQSSPLPARPIHCGDCVTLCVESRVVWANGRHAVGWLTVLVTRRHRYLSKFRGEIISIPDRLLFTPAELRIGMPIVFRPRDVFVCFDNPHKGR